MRMAVVGPCSERYCMKVDVDLTRKRTRTHLQSNSTVSQPREHNVTCREFESWQGCESRGGSGNDCEQLLVLNQPHTRNLKMSTINPPTTSLTTVLLEVIPRHHHMLPHNVFQHARAVGTVRRHVDTGFNCSNVAGTHVKHADGRRAAGFETESRFRQERRTDSVDVPEKRGDGLKGLANIEWWEI